MNGPKKYDKPKQLYDWTQSHVVSITWIRQDLSCFNSRVEMTCFCKDTSVPFYDIVLPSFVFCLHLTSNNCKLTLLQQTYFTSKLLTTFTKMDGMDWFVSLPKIELHAHLNGSIRDKTVLELARVLGEKGVISFSGVEDVIKKDDRTLHEVFKLFDFIHVLTTDHDTLTRITKEVVEDFASENVVYLELRTTPKKNDSKGMTKRSYIEAVIAGLKNVSSVDLDFLPHNSDSVSVKDAYQSDGNARKKIFVRLLLSIDRRETTEAAMETVRLALEMRDLGVVGIDLSGKPTVGEWSTFVPALQYAREQGLYITLHCGEVPNHVEIQNMLDFQPHRIGHACHLEGEEWKTLKSSNIPVEICLTSNIMTQTISSIDIHHFYDLYKAKHPITLCTDDVGVFSTTLSNEYKIASSAFGLGKKEMFQLSRNAVEFIFADAGVKQELETIFNLASTKLDL